MRKKTTTTSLFPGRLREERRVPKEGISETEREVDGHKAWHKGTANIKMFLNCVQTLLSCEVQLSLSAALRARNMSNV